MHQKYPKKFSLMNYLTAALGIIVVLGLVYALANYWPTHASESQPSHTSDVAKNENLEAGEAYMARIAETPGMESLGGGIYYKVLAEGKTNRLICSRHGSMVDLDLEEGLAMKKGLNAQQYEVLQAMTGLEVEGL